MKPTSRTIKNWGLASMLVAGTGLSQEEPASELGDDYAGEYAPEAEGETGFAENDSPAEAPAATQDDSWESYSDLSRASSVAEDITDGVRVEDIVEPPSDYRYAAFGKPDPFVPPVITQAERVDVLDAPGAIEIPIVSMLQKHELSTLRIVGIYSVHSGERKALVMTPDGSQAAVSVKIGDPIGNRGGKVLAIGVSAVTVREFTLAADGTRQYDDLEMFLGEPEDQAIGARIRFEPGAATTKIIENDNIVKAVEDGDPVDAPANETIQVPANLPNAPVAPAGALPNDLPLGQTTIQNQTPSLGTPAAAMEVLPAAGAADTVGASVGDVAPQGAATAPSINIEPETKQDTPASSAADGKNDGYDY